MAASKSSKSGGSAGKGGSKPGGAANKGGRTPNAAANPGKGRVEVKVDLGSAGGGAVAVAEAPPPRLKERYKAEIAPALREEFALANVMQIPTLTKIVVNMGVGEAARDAKLIDGAVRDLTIITGQKPAVARARKSVAQFKLREGMPIGVHVTLRGARMWSSAT